MAEQLDLSDQQRRVYQAAAEIEAEGEPGTLQAIANRAGMAVSDTRDALSALTGQADLLREVGTTQPDMGPRYSVKGQPAPG